MHRCRIADWSTSHPKDISAVTCIIASKNAPRFSGERYDLQHKLGVCRTIKLKRWETVVNAGKNRIFK